MTTRTLLLPDLGEGLTEAEIVRWLVAEGDDIQVDQPVVEVETAKAMVEVPAPFPGRVVSRHGEEGQTLLVGAPLISVDGGEEAGDEADHGGSGSVLVGSGTATPQVPRRRLRPRQAAVPGERRVPLTAFGRAAAANLTRSRSEIPEATVWVDVDATPLWDRRVRGRGPDGSGPGLLAYIASYVVAALRRYPMLNGRFDSARQEIVESDLVNLGIAVQGGRGLVVPVIREAGSMSVVELDAAIAAAVDRARRDAVTPAELAAGTFTLNNFGGLGVDGSAAIINYPQVAILGVGRILDRPWVVDGEIKPRKMTQLSFVFDHRVCDGVAAAGFVRAVADAIEDPTVQRDENDPHLEVRDGGAA